MRSVIVSTPDYESLQIIHTARRLYQRRGLQGKEKQDMARRFAEGYKMLSLMVEGDPPQA
jgi:glycerol-3-phosphate O-acyltransferase/dihydroxyacetone phosphate acyltransferase